MSLIRETMAILPTHYQLACAVNSLCNSGFKKEDIAIQAKPDVLELHYKQRYIKPEKLILHERNNEIAPKETPRLEESRTWFFGANVLAFTLLGFCGGIVLAGSF
jgi:hypothetical protein